MELDKEDKDIEFYDSINMINRRKALTKNIFGPPVILTEIKFIINSFQFPSLSLFLIQLQGTVLVNLSGIARMGHNLKTDTF